MMIIVIVIVIVELVRLCSVVDQGCTGFIAHEDAPPVRIYIYIERERERYRDI